MMRWAVFAPTPFTAFSFLSSPLTITISSSDGAIADNIMRAVLAPTPLTPISCWKSTRS